MSGCLNIFTTAPNAQQSSASDRILFFMQRILLHSTNGPKMHSAQFFSKARRWTHLWMQHFFCCRANKLTRGWPNMRLTKKNIFHRNSGCGHIYLARLVSEHVYIVNRRLYIHSYILSTNAFNVYICIYLHSSFIMKFKSFVKKITKSYRVFSGANCDGKTNLYTLYTLR